MKLKRIKILEQPVKIKGGKKMNIDLIRGDTLNIEFEITSETAIDLSDEGFDVKFSVKQAATNNNYIFQKDKTAVTQKAGNTFVLRVAPEDTQNLRAGWYYYDLQITLDDDVYTILIGMLQLIRDITLPPSALPDFIYPDVNGDDTVNNQDVNLIWTAYMNIATGEPSGLTDEQEDIADCNRDGRIDSTDVSLAMLFISEVGEGKYVNNAEGWSEFMANHYEIQG